MKDIISKNIAKAFYDTFKENMESYNEKPKNMSNNEWLAELFVEKIADMTMEIAKTEANNILDGIKTHENNLDEIRKANEQGISNEQWLAKKLEKVAEGQSPEVVTQTLKDVENILYHNTLKAEDFQKSIGENGDISNVDLNKKQFEETRYNYNCDNATNTSAEISVTDYETLKKENYSMQFGETAQDTIKQIIALDSNGNIIVPNNQIAEINDHFNSQNIQNIGNILSVQDSDFTQDLMEEIIANANANGGVLDPKYYDAYNQNLRINKLTQSLAYQNASVISKLTQNCENLLSGEEVKTEDIIDLAEEGIFTKLKVVTAGTIKTSCEKGMLSKIIPKGTKGSIIGSIASAAVNTIDTFKKIVDKKISVSQGVEEMGRNNFAEVGGAVLGATGAKGGAVAGSAIGTFIAGPVGTATGAVIGSLVGGVVAHSVGSEVGKEIHSVARQVCTPVTRIAETVTRATKNICNNVKNVATNAVNKAKRFLKGLFS